MPEPRLYHCSRGYLEDPGPIGKTMICKLLLIRLKQRTEVERHMRKRVRLDLLKPQLRSYLCDRASKSWSARKSSITAKPANLR